MTRYVLFDRPQPTMLLELSIMYLSIILKTSHYVQNYASDS